MQWAVSDLAFGGFNKKYLSGLPLTYNIEFFYEFGTDHYWDTVLLPLAQNNKEKRTFSIHGPCVAVNLADSSDEYYLKAYAQTFTYAQKIKAEFVVVHTNEIYHGEVAAVKELVYQRLAEVISLAQSYGVQVVIENVGLRPCGSLLFDFEEYLALFERYPQALALLDTGHAHVNGWNLPETVKRLQKKLGIPFIYITHDQEEAINMSDRIVVMNQGQFEQIGTPDEIYNHPKTSYVATFVGNANILKGKVVEINGSYAQVQIGNDTVSVYTEEIVKVGEQLTLAVRSENILLDEAEMENVVEQNEAEGTGRHLHATVKEKNFAAGQLRVLLALSDGTELTASRFGMNANIQPGQQIKWYFDPRNAIVVDREFKTKEPADMSGGNQ